MKESSANKVVRCDECKVEFDLCSVEIKEAPCRIDTFDLTLCYFTCPACNKLYRVCLKDRRYDELIAELNKSKKRIRRNFGSKNMELSSALNFDVSRKQAELRWHMSALNAKFCGTFTLPTSENKDGENFVVYHEKRG